MTDMPVNEMGAMDYLSNALMKLGDVEAAYQDLLAADLASLAARREALANAWADAGIAISLGSARSSADGSALDAVLSGEFHTSRPEDADLIAAIHEDTGGAPLVDDHEVDPEMERFLARRNGRDDGELSLLQESEAAEARFFGDLLAGPDEDREDRIAREHDERSADWQRAVEEDDQ